MGQPISDWGTNDAGRNDNVNDIPKLKPLNEIVFKPFRCAGGEFYWFDNDGICRKGRNPKVRPKYRHKWSADYIDSEDFVDYGNGNLFSVCATNIEVGQTTADFNELLKKYFCIFNEEKERTGIGRYYPEKVHYSEIEKFVTRISRPIFIRTPENKKRNTFDYIRFDVNLNTSFENKNKYLKRNIKDIIQMVNERLQNDTCFKRKGISINYLSVTKVMKDTNNSLVVIYELKKELREMQEVQDENNDTENAK